MVAEKPVSKWIFRNMFFNTALPLSFFPHYLQFERRLVSVGNTMSPEELFTSTSPAAAASDIARMQTVFRGGKAGRENHVKTSKYHWLTFIPVNIWEQFRRMVNFYFLVLIILAYVIPQAPVKPSSWVLSLSFIVFVTMVNNDNTNFLVSDTKRFRMFSFGVAGEAGI